MPTNRNEIAGKARKASGIVKETAGRATGIRRLQEQGAAEKTAGGARGAIGTVQRKAGKAVRAAKQDLRKP